MENKEKIIKINPMYSNVFEKNTNQEEMEYSYK
jgi:hypothetical protein